MSSSFRLGSRYRDAAITGIGDQPFGVFNPSFFRKSNTGDPVFTAILNLPIPSGEGTTVDKRATNVVVDFQNKIYGWYGKNILEFTHGKSAEQSLSLEVNQVVAANSAHIGLYPMVIRNKRKLVTAYQGTSNFWKMAILDGDTLSWTQNLGGSAFTTAVSDVAAEIKYNNKLYFALNSSASLDRIYLLDPTSQGSAFSEILLGEQLKCPVDFCVYNNSLYLLGKNNSRHVVVHKVIDDGIGGTKQAV